jgi:hypothetical protein
MVIFLVDSIKIKLNNTMEYCITPFLLEAKDKGINVVVITYSGGGDDGCIDSIDYYKSKLDDLDGSGFDIKLNHEDVFKDYCTDTLLENIEDWYSDEGGYGRLVVYLDDMSYTIDNHQYEQITHEYKHEGTLKNPD